MSAGAVFVSSLGCIGPGFGIGLDPEPAPDMDPELEGLVDVPVGIVARGEDASFLVTRPTRWDDERGNVLVIDVMTNPTDTLIRLV